MREIKFRAWDAKRKIMVILDEPHLAVGYPDDVPIKLVFGDDFHDDYEGGYDVISIDVQNLMQYTGLKDKNGVEIFEGDIVTDGTINKAPVIWDKYRWNIQEYYNTSYDYPSEAFSEGMPFEVIGNIYQNSELLSPTETK